MTVKRKARIFLDKVSAVDLRKNQLEEAFDKLIEHTYALADTNFDPLTAPQVMGEYLNKQMADLLNKADLTLATSMKSRSRKQREPCPKKIHPPHYPQLHQPHL